MTEAEEMDEEELESIVKSTVAELLGLTPEDEAYIDDRIRTHNIIMGLFMSLSACDNMSDVAGAIERAMKLLGTPIKPGDWSDLHELYTVLDRRGVKSLWQLK